MALDKIPRKENNIYLIWKICWAFAASTGILALIISFFSLNTGFSGMTPPLTYAVVVFFLAAFLPLYLLPAYFAYRKQLEKKRLVFGLNLLLGWTVVGYIACAFYVRAHK